MAEHDDITARHRTSARPQHGRAGLPSTLSRREEMREILPLADHLAQAVTWGV
ncbi:hypothetical protein [Nocardioides massiliensis]|uniref:Uncharacterized protein n=1 Tax=Nocardioides massiliensis TaxID=1325935 RepID=A0ABT9NUR0_9ACTN|nr:hypothetical protein [Nocardioides massiliensis]MDP9823889.1 hypothetical protein [Nocardioides massiliensis]